MNKTVTFKSKAVKKLCVLAMLTAVTAVLSIYCTFRIGSTVKIPFKFISVFITGALMGPVYGGAAAAVGDILNLVFAPSGQWIPLITVVEFITGIVYGFFFYNHSLSGKTYVVRVILCVLVQFAVDILITSFILTSVDFFPSYSIAIGARLPAGIIKAIIQSVFLIGAISYLPTFKSLLRS